MAETAGDLVIASGASVDLHRLIWLHVRDLELALCVVRHPNTAQSTSAATTASAIATITRSVPRFACARNGFSPMPSTVAVAAKLARYYRHAHGEHTHLQL